MPKTYYQILQVDPEASTDVIEVAYKRLIRLNHPDVNRSPDANQRTVELNEAHEVLHDPKRRAEYDRGLRRERQLQVEARAKAEQGAQDQQQHSGDQRGFDEQQYKPPPKAGPGSADSVADRDVACRDCGRSDASLRITVMPYVISLAVFTWKRAWIGAYCPACRRRRMRKAKLLTLLFGMLGFPGMLRAMWSLCAPSEGHVQPEINGGYLARLAAWFVRHHQYRDAQRALDASLQYQDNPGLRRLYREAFGMEPVIGPAPRHGEVGGLVFGLVSSAVILSICVWSWLPADSGPSYSATSAQRSVPASWATATPRPHPVSPPKPSPTAPYLRVRVPEADYSVSIPRGYELVPEKTDDPDLHYLWFQPRDGFAGRHYTTFMVLSVFNSSGIQLTHAETLDVIATLTDGMEMWQADRDLRFISSSSYVGLTFGGTAWLPDSSERVRVYWMTAQNAEWFHVIAAMGYLDDEAQVRKHFEVFRDSFEPDPVY
ncbi:MAG: J domain-containing protein [Anaerolineae bacterium]